MIPLIRNGIFNERDENGYPVNYPFISESMGASDTAYDYTNNEHQAVALQAAQESIVLLKNDNNILPLAKDANVAVAGRYRMHVSKPLMRLDGPQIWKMQVFQSAAV